MRTARGKQLPPLARLLPALAAVAALLAIAALVAGCGSSNETTSTQGESSAAGGESSTTETAPPPGATTSTAPPGASVLHCTASANDTSELQATGVSCSLARATASAWGRVQACSSSNSSRHSCTVGAFRCQSATTDRGMAVSCSGPGRSISFISNR